MDEDSRCCESYSKDQKKDLGGKAGHPTHQEDLLLLLSHHARQIHGGDGSHTKKGLEVSGTRDKFFVLAIVYSSLTILRILFNFAFYISFSPQSFA